MTKPAKKEKKRLQKEAAEKIQPEARSEARPEAHPEAQSEVQPKIQPEDITGLPRIYQSGAPAALRAFLLANVGPKVAILHAPTGAGKTFSACRLSAEFVRKLRKKGVRLSANILMPFRVSVKAMHSYLMKVDAERSEGLKYGYGISGDSMRSHADDCTLQTTGYFLESFINQRVSDELKVIMLDEAHDASWQTDLVLSYLMWRIKKGDNIKLIISSATLDVQKIQLQYGVETLPIVMEEENKNHVIIFNDDGFYSPISDISRSLAQTFYKVICDTVRRAYAESKTGHVLVLMPGQDEIAKAIEEMEKSYPLDAKAMVIGLHSQLSKEDITFAIADPEDPQTRKVIFSTNVVENAITINGLSAVVDSCVRKEIHVTEDGITELVMSMASKSNCIQAAGRCGRQGVKGLVYITIPEWRFESLQPFSLNEVERNPLYNQLMKIFSHSLPHNEILSHVSPTKLRRDISYLMSHGMIEEVGENLFAPTESGRMISRMPCGIRVGNFVVKCIEFVDEFLSKREVSKKFAQAFKTQFYFYACLTAAWIEHNGSVFENVFRRPQESNDDFHARLELTEEIQAELFGEDCYDTFLNIWSDSHKAGNNFFKWCKDHRIFSKALIEIDRSTKDMARALSSILNIDIPFMNEVLDFENIVGMSLKDLMLSPMVQAFNNSLFCYGGPPKRMGQKPEYTPLVSGKRDIYGSKYIFDRSAKNGIGDGRPVNPNIVALNIRQKGNMFFLSSIVSITPPLVAPQPQ